MTDFHAEVVLPPIRRRRQLSGTVRVAQRFVRTPSAVLGLVLLGTVVAVALFATVLAPGQAYAATNPLLAPPSRAHPMGTDNLQRDLFHLFVYGMRRSMTVVVFVVAISSAIGLALGLAAGYVGGIVDDAVVRVSELLQSVPRFFLAVLVVGVYGPGLSKIVLVLSLTSWTFLARVTRAEALSTKRRPFVEAARAAGSSGLRTILTHVLPNVLPRAIVVIVLMGSRVILIEAGLAFLGLGDPLRPSLGMLARNANDFLRQAWWMSVFPGLGIVTAVLGMNLLSDGLGQALDPQRVARAEANHVEAAAS